MKVKVLGTQSPYSTEGHHCPGFLVTKGETKILLDCGSGINSLLNFPEDLKNLNIIISHLHRDHYSDLFNLFYASAVFKRQGRLNDKINVYLPSTPELTYKDICSEKDSYANIDVINQDKEIKINDIKITFSKNDHPVETYSVKITDGKKTIVYTSDVSYSSKDKLVKFSSNADLLISEASLLVSHGFPEICNHLTAKQAATIAKDANVKKLVLTHFWPEENLDRYLDEAEEVFDNVFVAIEKMIIE
ncbi:Metallo-hydrolase/oxidoreductase [Anaeromyces robustus]|uniref:Metallo-hydrolase/oxidoreductase n=1 Tax=Anaeromyces robustus TaxID=1754192 RepID=A0A1Y1WRE3_9FUNG|nr:Metallo-hydrolase/oxidoreductase [Anaeromyces robustus]|eukprot:ORX75694.1 Metallo-hydrolase/oxidoreductase [Anaeromyces robustus]